MPLNVSVGGLQLNPYNLMLLVFIVPAFLYWLQHQPRVIGLDVFMLLYIFWIAVAIYHTHGTSRIVYIINQSVTLLGSYMLGRVLVRNADDYRRMFTILFWILLFLLPFALVELVLKINRARQDLRPARQQRQRPGRDPARPAPGQPRSSRTRSCSASSARSWCRTSSTSSTSAPAPGSGGRCSR